MSIPTSKGHRGQRSCGVCADDQELFAQMRRQLTSQATATPPTTAIAKATQQQQSGSTVATRTASNVSHGTQAASSAALASAVTAAALAPGAASANLSSSSPAAASSSAAASGAATAAAASLSAMQAPLPCPATSASLGRASWTFLHTTAAWYPEQPSDATQKRMTSFLDNFAHFYPCTYCATHFQQHVAASPPPVQSRSLLTRFLCNYHNDVNARLGKRTFNCARYDERWRYGPAAEAPYDCVEDAGPTEADEAR